MAQTSVCLCKVRMSTSSSLIEHCAKVCNLINAHTHVEHDDERNPISEGGHVMNLK